MPIVNVSVIHGYPFLGVLAGLEAGNRFKKFEKWEKMGGFRSLSKTFDFLISLGLGFICPLSCHLLGSSCKTQFQLRSRGTFLLVRIDHAHLLTTPVSGARVL